MPLEVKGHAGRYYKDLNTEKYELRGWSCGSSLNICQDVLKNTMVQHKQSFIDSQAISTVMNLLFYLFCERSYEFWVHNLKIPYTEQKEPLLVLSE